MDCQLKLRVRVVGRLWIAISIGSIVSGCQPSEDQQSPPQSISGSTASLRATQGGLANGGIPTKARPIRQMKTAAVGTAAVAEQASMMAGGLTMSGGSRVIVDSSDGSIFALNAYGGATDGGEVRLWQDCPKDNPDCMWYFRYGMIVSARNSALAIRPRGGVSLNTDLILDSNCTMDVPECTWVWHMGMLQNVADRTYAINASDGATQGGPLVLDNGCTESNTNCTFTIESARMSLAADHRTGIYAGDAPAAASEVQLATIWPCPINDSRCTWTLRQGLVTTDSDPTLAMYAFSATAWATVRLSDTCAGNDPKCTWTFDGRRLLSDVTFSGMDGQTSLALVPTNGPLTDSTGTRTPLRLAPIGAGTDSTVECDNATPGNPVCPAGYVCVKNNDPLKSGQVSNDYCVAECCAQYPTNPACVFEVGSPVPIAWSGTPAAKAKWTLMVLHFTDGAFSFDVTWDEAKMGQSGSSPDVNIVALLDTPDGYDRTQGYVPLYRGRGLYLRVNRNASPTILKELGEVNMGDASVEGNFADFVATYFPAENYIVTTYDHGVGWRGFGMDLTGSGMSIPSGATDGGPYGAYGQMLSRMNSAFGKKLGVIALDGCLNGMWEVAVASAPYSQFMVGSEASSGPTLNYAEFMPMLVATPTMAAQELATAIARTYTIYADPLTETMAATNLSSTYFGQTGSLTSAVNALGHALRDPGYYDCVEQARTAAMRISLPNRPDGVGYFDLYYLADQIGIRCGTPAIQTLATAVKQAVADGPSHAVVAVNNDTGDPRGLAIYMPDRCTAMESPYYKGLGSTWSQQTEWDEFLRGFAPPSEDMTNEANPRPLPVSGVVASPLATRRARVSWSPSPTYGSTYEVRRGTSPGAYSDSFIVPYASGTVWTDTGLSSNTRYYYDVIAGNCDLYSDRSAEVSVGPPSVSITSPANNASFAAPATITITAAASDPDVGDGISKVEFYHDGTLLGTDTGAPYTFTWSNVAAGSYVIWAKAYDLTGFAATSVQVPVTVVANNPCTGLCHPWVVKPGPGIQQGYLGTAEVCDQTMATLRGGNCGNMSGRTFQVNGTTMTCNGQTWASLPPKRNGGYCLHATAGGFAYAYYTTW